MDAKLRESTGGAYERRGAFFIRVTVAPQKRQAERAPWATSLGEAVERGKLVQGWVNALRLAGREGFIKTLVELGAAAASVGALADVRTNVEALAGGHFELLAPVAKAVGPVTFRTFAERWTSGELHDKYPSHVGEKKSVRDDAYRFDILSEIVGDVALVDFTIDHADEIMRRLDAVRRKRAGRDVRALDAGGRRQYSQLVARLLKLAAYPARIIKASPLPGGWLPRNPNNKAKGLLYPDEEGMIMGCQTLALHDRAFFGFLARTGLRVDEGASLSVKDVDLDRGIVTMDENKTDDPRAPMYGPDLMIGLRLYKRMLRTGAGPDDPFFVRPDGARYRVSGLAKFYRERFVKIAGVDRPELYTRTKTRIPIRVHDLRGFFITYSLAGGATETWVMDRTGHRSSAMVNRYRRVARTVTEAGLDAPTPLHQAIPEFAAAFTAADAAADAKQERQERSVSSRKSNSIGLIAQLVELRTFKSDSLQPVSSIQQDSALSTNATKSDCPSSDPMPPRSAAALGPSDEELERAIVQAVGAGLSDVARVLAGQLEARQRARAGNVVPFDARRRER